MSKEHIIQNKKKKPKKTQKSPQMTIMSSTAYTEEITISQKFMATEIQSCFQSFCSSLDIFDRSYA